MRIRKLLLKCVLRGHKSANLAAESDSDQSAEPASVAGTQTDCEVLPTANRPPFGNVGRPAVPAISEQSDGDHRFMLSCGAVFLVILTAQYVALVLDEPVPLPWQHGEAFQLFQVEVNSGTWIEWSQLDGIGPSLAHRIVADREAHGPFSSIDDLQRVEGIGPATLDRIRSWLTIRAPAVRLATDQR